MSNSRSKSSEKTGTAPCTGEPPERLPELYRAVFESTPLAIFVVNRNFRIVDANRRFSELFPGRESEREPFCYRVIPPGERDTPCPDCLVRRAFMAGKAVWAEERAEKNGSVLYYRKEASPLFSKEGEITWVMESIEDITARVESEQRREIHSRELESAIDERTREQKEKEHKLTVLVDTVYEIKGARDIHESIDRITRAYTALGAQAVVFALFDGDDMHVARLHPPEILARLNSVFRKSVMESRLNKNRHPQNPFINAVLVGKPTFARGEREIFNFFKSCCPESYDHEIAEAAFLFKNQSQVIFPLVTQNCSVGAVAVFADNVLLEQNFEYYSFLANSAMLEIKRQQSSERLHKSELKYRTLVENSRDMIILCGADGKIRYVNRAFSELTGISAVHRREQSIYSLFPAPGRERIREVTAACMQSNSTCEAVELKMKTPRNRELWTEIMVSPASEEISGFQIVARDISHRKNLELLIGNMSEFQEKILQNDIIGIITTDLSGRITSWNRGATHILGYSIEETLQKNIAEFIVSRSPGSQRKFMRREDSFSEEARRELKLKRKGAEPVDVTYVESSMKDETGSAVAVIAFFFDNTEKAKLEEKWKELTMRLQQAQLITIVSLAKLAEYRDIETGMHLERIMKYTEFLSRELSGYREYRNYISDEYIHDLVNSCPLHDIGKVGIPDVILHKPGKLTTEEFEIIKKHTIIGGDTIAEAEKKVHGRSYLNLGKEIAYYHHERWDGKGYPQGLKGEQIPLSARIVAVADVYDALISKRPYKDPFPHEIAVDIISASSNTHFDETVVKAFMKCEKNFATMKSGLV